MVPKHINENDSVDYLSLKKNALVYKIVKKGIVLILVCLTFIS